MCRGYIRNLGLSANQLLHVPGAGDFQLERIEVLSPPGHADASSKPGRPRARAVPLLVGFSQRVIDDCKPPSQLC